MLKYKDTDVNFIKTICVNPTPLFKMEIIPGYTEGKSVKLQNIKSCKIKL